jgi:NADH-quinone oxidoreductase subunit M
MLSHGLISAGLFMSSGVIYSRTKSRVIDEQSGIAQVMPIFSALMMFFLLSNSGLPGTSGFVGEFMVLVASANESFIYATLASLTLVLAATYSLWLGKRVLFGKISGSKVSSMKMISPYEFWPLFILVVSIIIIGLKPGFLLGLSEQSSLNMIRIITGGY